MCLNEIIEDEEIPGSGIGYKVFLKSYGGPDNEFVERYIFPYYDHYYGMEEEEYNIVLGKKLINTIKVSLPVENGYDNNFYVSGFHVFLSLEDAISFAAHRKNAVIVKVFFDKVTALGRQLVLDKGVVRDRKCIVADEITLLEEICV